MKTIRFCKIIFLFYMLVYAINGTAQTSDYNAWKTNYDKGLELFERDSLNKALVHLEKSLDIAESKKIDSLQIRSLHQIRK